MNIDILPYNLPDIEILKTATSNFEFSIWQPDKIYLVLGQSNTAENSLLLDKVYADKIPVLKRPSGGETVVLTPKTLVISAVVVTQNLQNPHKYFKYFNEILISAIQQLGIKDIAAKGISDLTIGNKKILGSSIYRHKDKLFYHAVLNVAETTETIVKYIKNPKREPDYRKGRDHKDFVTSIVEHYPSLDESKLKELIKEKFSKAKYQQPCET